MALVSSCLRRNKLEARERCAELSRMRRLKNNKAETNRKQKQANNSPGLGEGLASGRGSGWRFRSSGFNCHLVVSRKRSK